MTNYFAQYPVLGGGGGGGAVWGSITGTLSNQTDLQNALNAKWTIGGNTGNNLVLGTTGDGTSWQMQTAASTTGNTGNINVYTGDAKQGSINSTAGYWQVTTGAGWNAALNITTPGAIIGVSGGNLIQSGSIFLRGGDGGPQGGDIDINAGDCDTTGAATNNNGGHLFLTAGVGVITTYGQRPGGSIALYGGGPSGQGGVSITAGTYGSQPGGGGITIADSDPATPGSGFIQINSGQDAMTNSCFIQVGPCYNSSGGDILLYPSPTGNIVLQNGGSSEIQAWCSISMKAAKPINFLDGPNTHYVSIGAPSSINTSYSLFWPTDPSPGIGYTFADAGGGQLGWQLFTTFADLSSALGGYAALSGAAFSGNVQLTGLNSQVLCTDASGNIIGVPSGSIGPVVNNGSGSFTYFQTGTSGSSAFTANASANIFYLESTSTGGIGTTEYSFPDLVAALKNMYAISA